MKQCAAVILPLIVLGETGVAAEVVTVRIVDMSFVPADVSIKAGDAVQWVNGDFVDHTATARDGGWDVLIRAGKSAQHQFKQTGVLNYFCKIHPDMKAVIRVAQ
jgi:plastocyanin